MTKTDQQITADDARAALESVALAKSTTINSMKPPRWLILICSLCLGVVTIGMGLMIDSSLWQTIKWVAYVVICSCIVIWVMTLRSNGIKVKIVDVKIAKMGILAALLICTLLMLSRAIYLTTDSYVFPYIAGLVNALTLAYSLNFNLRLNTHVKAECHE